MFSLLLGCGESFIAHLDNESSNHTIQLGPNNREVTNGSVGNPHLGTIQQVVVPHIFCLGNHATGVRTVIGFGQSEATDDFALGHSG